MCIGLLQLEYQPSFEVERATLIETLELKSDKYFRVIRTTEEAYEAFQRTGEYAVILATDNGLALNKHRKIRAEAAIWTSMGGELFFAGQFASLATPKQINNLFSTFGIPWEAGDIIEAEFDVNKDMKRVLWDDLPYRFNQKARCLKNVRDDEAVYRPCPWEEDIDLKQASVLLFDNWDGWVGYIGDLEDKIDFVKALRSIMLMSNVGQWKKDKST